MSVNEDELPHQLSRELLESDRCPGPDDAPYIRQNRLIEFYQRIDGDRYTGFRLRYDHPDSDATGGAQLLINRDEFIEDLTDRA